MICCTATLGLPLETLRIAVVAAGMQAPACHPAPAWQATVASIEEALAVARAQADGRAVEIVLAAGVHRIERSVRIGRDDPVALIAGCEGARVVGGWVDAAPAWEVPPAQAITAVDAQARPQVRAWRLPGHVRERLAGPVHSGHGIETAAVHSEVFVGGRALVPARWPNNDANGGYAAIGELVDPGSAPRNAMDDIPAAQRVVEPDRGGIFVPAERGRVARWAGADDAWAFGFWNWDWSHELLPIAAVEADAGRVLLGRPHRYGLAPRGRFFVTNVLAELDSEGECWIDRAAGIVYAWLPPGAAGREASVSLVGEPLLVLEGVRGLAVRGVQFECTRGHAVEAQSCTDVRVEDCVFRAIGVRGLRLDGSKSRVARCRFLDIGGTGVLLTGGDRATLAPGGNAVERCDFRECGRVLRSYSPAVVVEGVGNRVSRCTVTRHPHIALWFRGNDHLIEANEFSEVVYETGDAGAIYCGRDWTAQGTVVRGNLFRDIRGSDARYQNGVYLDDMSSGITVEDNVFVRCNWGVLVGGGRDNTLRRNTFVACAKAVSWDARGVGWMAPSIADPATSTLHRSYAAVPVDSEPWRSRYPHLGDYLTFDFGRPVRGVLAGSHLIGTPLGRIDDRKRVVESGTLSEPGEGAALAARAEDTVRAWRAARGD